MIEVKLLIRQDSLLLLVISLFVLVTFFGEAIHSEEGLFVGLSTKELLQHLVSSLECSRRQNCFPVSHADLFVHDSMLLEHREDVTGVHERPEVAIVATLVASEHVTEGRCRIDLADSISVRIFISRQKWLQSAPKLCRIDPAVLSAQLLVHVKAELSDAEFIVCNGLIFSLGKQQFVIERVQKQIKSAEENLGKSILGVTQIFDGDLLVDEVLG